MTGSKGTTSRIPLPGYQFRNLEIFLLKIVDHVILFYMFLPLENTVGDNTLRELAFSY